MLEIPETTVLAQQLNEAIQGKRVQHIEVNAVPHKFAFHLGKPEGYDQLVKGKTMGQAVGFGSWVEISVGDAMLAFSEGSRVMLLQRGEKRPQKHQLLIEFSDGAALVLSVQMYGAIGCTEPGGIDNLYYHLSKDRIGPLSPEFTFEYFYGLTQGEGMDRLSLKAFLATEQRIPGLGNGVLQDILYNARLHPKRKMNDLKLEEVQGLFHAIKATLKEMIDLGGRDTETDLYGKKGSYLTKMSKYTVGRPCVGCNTPIQKENYMGGSIYYCGECQAF